MTLTTEEIRAFVVDVLEADPAPPVEANAIGMMLFPPEKIDETATAALSHKELAKEIAPRMASVLMHERYDMFVFRAKDMKERLSYYKNIRKDVLSAEFVDAVVELVKKDRDVRPRMAKAGGQKRPRV
ncbi:hypothetical protein EMVG_00064 [Emiliania huxleyi virus PS401]|nr:hypothetical protein EMVG_00064 [Emiliania huxleyi virus PS401]